MRVPVASMIGLALLGGACGCHGYRRDQLLERELHAREEDVREMRDELNHLEASNQALFNDLRYLRGDGCTPIPTDACGTAHAIGLAPVRSIVLGRQTGGHNDGHCVGDDALQVQVEPRDPEGHAIKINGSLLVQALEITNDGVKKPLSSWEICPEQLRKEWHQGLFSSGYLVTLPWKIWPSTEKLRVVAQFHPIDGRVFENEKDITIHLPPPDQRHVLPPPPEPPAPMPATPLPAGPLPSGPLPVTPMPPNPDMLPPPKRVVPPGTEQSGPSLGPDQDADGQTQWRPVPPSQAVEMLRPTAGP